MMLPWRFCWQSMTARPNRMLLTLLGIALGVAAVVSVLHTTLAIRRHFTALEQLVGSKAALEIVGSDGDFFPLADLPELQTVVPGLQTAVPLARRYTHLFVSDQKIAIAHIGTHLAALREIRDVRFAEGQPVEPGMEGEEVLMALPLARALNIQAGDTIRILTRLRLRPVELRVVGLLEFPGPTGAEYAQAVFMELPEMLRLWRMNQVHAVELVVDPSASLPRLQSAIASQLPASLSVRPKSSPIGISESMHHAVNAGLNTSASLSVVTALFIVLNTFLMSVTERQRQLAVMRIVGATERQVRHLLYQEAMLYALIGTCLGLVLGIGGGYLLGLAMQWMFRTHIAFIPNFPALLIGAIFGPWITGVAVILAARKIGTRSPLATLQGVTLQQSQRYSRWLVLVGVLAVFLSLSASYFFIHGYGTVLAGIIAMNVLLVGFVMLVPACLPLVSSSICRYLGRWLPVEAEMAHQQIVGYTSRSTLTVGVLFVVTCTAIGINATIRDITTDIERWLRRSFSADFIVSSIFPSPENAAVNALPKDVIDELSTAAGAAGVEKLNYVPIRIADVPVTLIVRELTAVGELPVELVEGEADAAQRQLAAGDLLLGNVAAHRLKLRVGDEVEFVWGERTFRQRIAGIMNEYVSAGQAAMIDRLAFQQVAPLEATQVLLIRAQPGNEALLSEQLQGIALRHGLYFQAFAEFRQEVQFMLAGFTTGMRLLLVLALLIAAFGIVNTLNMNVLEQAQSIGLLRMIGMDRRQVRRMIYCQAATLALAALLPAALVGKFLAFMISVDFEGFFGRSFQHRPQLLLIATILSLAMLLVLLASIVPARRAAALNPIEAAKRG
jgi:putative ABC transport system permease protein